MSGCLLGGLVALNYELVGNVEKLLVCFLAVIVVFRFALPLILL